MSYNINATEYISGKVTPHEVIFALGKARE